MLFHIYDMGFEVDPDEVVQATPLIQFLRIIQVSEKFELRVVHDRLSSILSEVYLWRSQKHARKCNVLSLIGKPVFMSRVVRYGHTIKRRLFEVIKKVKHLHHIVRFNHEFQADITWWLTFLLSWNGIVMMYKQTWTSSVDLHL